MDTIIDHVTNLVKTALILSELDDVLDTIEDVKPTKNPKNGDLQSNHAFKIAKIKGLNPRDVAEKVKRNFPRNSALVSVEVAGPGFINFKLSDGWLEKQCKKQLKDRNTGIPQIKKGNMTLIDYCSPNIAKQMHIGHMRSTIIGDTLHRMYDAAGSRVIGFNHIGDWGTPMGKLLVAWKRELDEDNFEVDPVGELERLYLWFGENKTSELLDLARKETVKLQKGKKYNTLLWKMFKELSLREVSRICERLGIEGVFKHMGESEYHHMLPTTVQELRSLGLATESDGSIVISFGSDNQDKMLNDTALLIQKKDGAYLYGTTDIAACIKRMWGYDAQEIIYVTDNRQNLHFKQVFTVTKAYKEQQNLKRLIDAELKHLGFGLLKMPEGVMATRQGNTIKLFDLMDEAVRRARAIVDEKSPHLPESERKKIAERVGISALRYSDLKQNPQSDVLFDWDKMLSFEGNTATFLLYAYARAWGILRKSENREYFDPSYLQITNDAERKLMLLILKFPIVFEQSLNSLRPNLICDYLFELASEFNSFYASVPVLSAKIESHKQARLSLVHAVTQVLAKGFRLLGLNATGKM